MNDTKEQAIAYLTDQGLFDVLERAPKHQLPPDWRDLARLHMLARQRKACMVLEFGVGRSTVVLADAVLKNKKEWKGPEQPFRVYSVDASSEWIASCREILPEELESTVMFQHSEVEAGMHNGRMCHYYASIPDVVPDFIYLDGPDPKDVQGTVHGLSWKNPNRTVMAADLLLMEPTLLPGTFVIIDGRTNNARFLANNLQRVWESTHSVEQDITTMVLAESPLGPKNKADLEYRLGHV